MNLLKHILLALLICLTSACSGSKMEPIGEDPFLNINENEMDGEMTLDDDRELTLDQDQDKDGKLTLAPSIPKPPARPSAPPPSARRPVRPAPHPVLTPRPIPEVGCPTCPLAPTVVDRPPCHPVCPQPPPPVVNTHPPCQPVCPEPSDCNVDVVTSSPTGYVGTKIVFVVDKGSHNYIPTENADGGNDPQKLTRVHHIHQFVEDHRDSGFSWSMITFYGRERGWKGFARAYISSDERGRQPIFTEDYNVISQAIEDLSARPDGPRRENRDHGKIQYGDALQLTEKLIKEDIERQDDAYYLVFFIAGESPRGHQERYPFDQYIYKEVEDIVSLKPERVFLSTGYYGWNHLLEHTYIDGSENPNVPNVTGILQYMASLGNGQFFHLENIARRYNAQATPCDLASPCDAQDTYYDDASGALSLPNGYQGNAAHVFSSPCSASNLSPEPVEMVRSSVLPCGHTEEEHRNGQLFCPYSP